MLDRFGLKRRKLINCEMLCLIYISLEYLATYRPEMIRTLVPQFSNADVNGVFPV